MTQQAFQAIPSAALQGGGASELADGTSDVFGLFVDYPNGKTSFLSFQTAFDRGLMVIALSSQPVALRPVTYR